MKVQHNNNVRYTVCLNINIFTLHIFNEEVTILRRLVQTCTRTHYNIITEG